MKKFFFILTLFSINSYAINSEIELEKTLLKFWEARNNQDFDMIFFYESKIGAWASDQSNTMKERFELLKKIEDFKKKYKNEKNVPRPPHWSGWCLRPSSIEFWLHRDNRIHERLRYNKTVNGWEKEILYP